MDESQPNVHDILGKFEAVARGELDAYVWRSGNHSGVLVCAEFVEVGEGPTRTEPEDYWRDYTPYYDGVMPIDEAEMRANAMRHARAREGV